MATIKQYVQGDLIKAEDHNTTQKNGVIFSKPTHTVVSQQSVYSLNDFTLEQPIFEGLKLKLLIDTDSLTDNSFISIKTTNYPVNEAFKVGNIYNLVCIKTTNDLGENNFSFIVEKTGGSGGASFRTLVDEIIDLKAGFNMTDIGIILPDENYNLINITLYYNDNIAGQDVISTIGITTAKELFIRSKYVDMNFAASNSIPCVPAERYSDMQLSIFAKPEIQTNDIKVFLFSQYGFGVQFNRIKIDVL